MKAAYTLIAVVAFIAMAAESRSASVLEKHPIGWYDCSGKTDGNYLHPTDCTRFISCSGNVASERDCAACDPILHPTRCPSVGRLVYSDTDDACLWADETDCKLGEGGNSDGPSTEPIDNETTEGETTGTTERSKVTPTTEAPQEVGPVAGDPCNPHNCTTVGNCLDYLRCDLDGKIWVNETCGPGLIWNPKGSDGKPHIHGGNCGDPKNLDEETLERYRNDRRCLQCYWEEIGECSSQYYYQQPDLIYPHRQELSCDAGLVFVAAKETCLRCQDVPKKSGGKCC